MAFQRELLHRGDHAEVADALAKLAASPGPLATQVAAIFTLKQLAVQKDRTKHLTPGEV